MKKIILGIDPGLSGGIAAIDQSGCVLSVSKMPSTMMDIYEHIKEIKQTPHDDIVCYIERVGLGMPGQSSKATATFARHCGQLEMALLALEISTVEVTPQKWMKYFAVGSSKDYKAKTEWKNHLKAIAQQRFPSLWKEKKVTLSTADALLIALYGKEKEHS